MLDNKRRDLDVSFLGRNFSLMSSMVEKPFI